LKIGGGVDLVNQTTSIWRRADVLYVSITLYVSFLHRASGVPPSLTDQSDEDGAKADGLSPPVGQRRLSAAALRQPIAQAHFAGGHFRFRICLPVYISVLNCWKTCTLKLDDGLVCITTLCNMICR